MWQIFEEFKRMSTDLGEHDTERARKRYFYKQMVRADKNATACEDIGRQVIFRGKRVPLSELNERLSVSEVNMNS